MMSDHGTQLQNKVGDLIGDAVVSVSLIAAMSKNRVVGKHGAVPWSIPADLRRFRELTFGHTVIMGRKTFESIGRPLPGRKNIVLTRRHDFAAAGTILAGSLDAALQLAEGDGEVFFCGGGDVYAQALHLAAKIYLTVVDLEIEGDALFPCIDSEYFEEVERERISFDPPADFIVLTRKTLAGTAIAI